MVISDIVVDGRHRAALRKGNTDYQAALGWALCPLARNLLKAGMVMAPGSDF